MKKIIIVIMMLLIIVASNTKAQEFLASQMLGDISTRHQMTGSVAGVRGNVYVITNKNDVIEQIIFIPMDEENHAVAVSEENVNLMMKEISKTLAIEQIDMFSTKKSVTFIMHKISYIVTIKLTMIADNKQYLLIKLEKL